MLVHLTSRILSDHVHIFVRACRTYMKHLDLALLYSISLRHLIHLRQMQTGPRGEAQDIRGQSKDGAPKSPLNEVR